MLSMKKTLLYIVMLLTSINIYATPVKYVGCLPENGSSISSFEFTLNFDIADALSSVEAGNWGIGYMGSLSNGRYVSLYEGTQDNGTEIATALTSNFSGKSEGFVVNGSSIDIQFPATLRPEVGKTYTLVIRNSFGLFQSGKSIPNSSTYLKYEASPLVLTFIGGAASSAELILQNVSISEDSQLDTLSEINFTFNESISVVDNAKVSIMEGTEIVYESASVYVSSDNSKMLSVKFPDGVELLNGHDYKLVLSAGTVSLVSDPAVVNKEFTLNIKGIGYKYYTAAIISPKDGDKGIFDSVSIVYSLPAGAVLTHEGIVSDLSMQLYKGEISSDNLVTSLYGTAIEYNTGLKWDLSDLSLEPSTDYILVREAGKGKLFKDGTTLREYSNEETKIRFSTPSVEESGYAPMELGKPTLRGGGTVVNDGDSYGYIDRLEITAPNLRYEYDGNRVGFFGDDESRCKGYLYDFTGETPQLVKEFVIDTQTRETTTSYYNILCMFINSILYEGHEYRIEMPEGAFTISAPKKLWNYVRTPAFALTVKGATPTEIKLQGTSIPEGAECSSLNDVIFKFNGDLTLNKDALGLFNGYDAQGKLNSTEYVPLTSYVSDNVTYVSAHLAYQSSGNPRTLRKGFSYTLTIPEGCVYVASMPEIANPETTLTVKGVEAPPVYTEPEYVSFSVSYMSPTGYISPESEYESSDYTVAYSVANDVVKGNKITLKFDLSAWKLEHLIRYNGDSATGTEVKDYAYTGTYTSTPLNDDARFEVVLSYDGDVVFSNTTSVAELENLDVRVFNEKENIMVEGLQGGERVTVYTTTGIVIGTHDAATGYDVMQISAPTGQTYIVRIQRGDKVQAAKIMH